jgi:hypothetical protein
LRLLFPAAAPQVFFDEHAEQPRGWVQELYQHGVRVASKTAQF